MPLARAARAASLVVGNSAYRRVPELINPKNDANAVAAALRNVGHAELIQGIGHHLGLGRGGVSPGQRDAANGVPTCRDRGIGAQHGVDHVLTEPGHADPDLRAGIERIVVEHRSVIAGAFHQKKPGVARCHDNA